ncbi:MULTISPECIES: GNAT family N-acetyltransferase [unclassified Paenibacillus]|uniref:GNAT family N-acetyltransferase n=1 Tax=unclassified Paenibacillus TaxID=185978 RepID=UPI0009573E8E|nr:MULTISPECIES: GNAT family N-acetyltransferase [unclassified Paenibacillus]ASS67914.1 GNAT family N-acetyltransferase [Paenibacillus sp. RUD330]SIR44167.1 N-acetylglutamate synthase, GNAT family [Paenibacillus sp. RU4X]SIR53975.1 N-acetylglutamate synthase, GNAT family [Paenibacillus sp. RU4T]
MGEIYRKAVKRDAQRLQEVVYGAYAQIRELELRWPAAHADLKLIEANIEANDCYVLELDGVIAATITLNREPLPESFGRLPFLKWFAAAPEFQGTGLGGRLLDWVEKQIIRDGLHEPAVTLATAEKHPWLLSMYERRGYKRFQAFDSGNGDGTMHLLRKEVGSAFEPV